MTPRLFNIVVCVIVVLLAACKKAATEDTNSQMKTTTLATKALSASASGDERKQHQQKKFTNLTRPPSDISVFSIRNGRAYYPDGRCEDAPEARIEKKSVDEKLKNLKKTGH